MNSIKDYAIQCIKDETQAALNLIPQLTDDFERAVRLMYHCQGKVIVTGVGKSGHVGAKIAATRQPSSSIRSTCSTATSV